MLLASDVACLRTAPQMDELLIADVAAAFASGLPHLLLVARFDGFS